MDEHLIQRVIKGDKEAFKQLYDLYFNKAMRTAIAITRNKELAKDAVQETFIRVYKNIASFQMEKPFDPWFYRILTNECNRILAREKKITPLHHTDLDKDVDIPSEEKADFTDLYEALQALKDIYRIPVILMYIKGFGEREIAEILELNQNTVKTRLFKGREKLKIQLELLKRRERHV